MKNDAVAGLVADKAPPRSLGWSVAAGAGLGAIGFGLNQFPVPLGFDAHFLLGSAVLLVGVRFDRSGLATIIAGIIAGYATVPLWGHPWAWMILVFEAMAVAYAARCRFPVIFADALYWMFAGGPLVFATYGGILNMNVASVSLVAAKQGLNGVANISLATMLMLLLYIAFPGFAVRFGASGIRTWLANILVFMLMLPTVLFLWSSFDAMRSSLFKVAAAINAIEASRVEALLGVEVRKIAHIVRANTSRYVADALIQSSPHVLAVVVAVDGELTEFVVPHKDAVQRLPPSAIPVDLRRAMSMDEAAGESEIFADGDDRFAIICDSSIGSVCALYRISYSVLFGKRTVVAVGIDLQDFVYSIRDALGPDLFVSFSDETGLRLSSSRPKLAGDPVMSPGAILEPTDVTDLALLLPDMPGRSLMARWTDGYFLSRIPVEPVPGLRLFAEVTSPMQKVVLDYRDFQQKTLVSVALFVLAAVSVTSGMAFSISRPITRLQSRIEAIVGRAGLQLERDNIWIDEIAGAYKAVNLASAALDAERFEVRRAGAV